MTSLTVELRTLLDQICKDRNSTCSSNIAMHLKDQLDANKSNLIKLLDNSPKNNEHRTMIQSGKTTINSKEHRVNEDFIKQVLFLSDQLDIDEFEASRYLLEGISKAPAMNSNNVDVAVYLYHEERGYILAILNVILETAKDDTLDVQITTVFYNFMAGIIADSSLGFVQKLLKSEKQLAGMINSLSKIGMLASAAAAAAAKQQINAQQQPTTSTTSSLFQPQQPQPQPQPQQHSPVDEMKFDPQTTSLRIDKLTDERVYLAEVLYHISSLYWLEESDLLAIIKKAQSANLSDTTCSYIIVALLSAISIQSKKPSQHNFTTNVTYLKNIHQQITTKPWKLNTLKATVEIRWALTIAELATTQPNVENTLSMNKSNRVKFVESALALDVFGFMNEYLLYFKQNHTDAADKKSTIGAYDMDVDGGSSAMAIDGLIVDPNDYTKFVAEIAVDFQKWVIQELEALTQSFIFNMADIFSNLKKMTLEQVAGESTSTTNGEDVIFASSLQKFLTLLASVYRDRLNAGLKFWDHTNGLSTFLPWLLEFKSPEDLAAIFDFLGAISTGEQCAPLAHNFLKMGISEADVRASHLFSWGKLFSALQFYGKEYTDRASTEEEPPTMPIVEEITLCKFLYVCQQVVQYSGQARLDIWSYPVLKVHESIVTMITCPTSTRFRAALYDLLSAFCSNWGGGINHVGESISLEVWNTLEFSDMILPEKTMTAKTPEESTIPVPPPVSTTPVNPLFGTADVATMAQKIQAHDILNKSTTKTDDNKPARPTPTYYLSEQPAGFMREYADEKSRRLYTETMSVLKLFSSLIHTESRRDQLVSGFVPTAKSIPVCLGHDNNRSPGTAPYMSLVIDHIFLNLNNQQYIYPETKWQLADACLNIIENSILAFNIQPVCDYIYYLKESEPRLIANYTNFFEGNTGASATDSAKTSNDLQQALLACVSHPGFDILIRILSGGSLIQEMFKIVEKGKDSFSSSCKTKSGKNMYFKNSMVRCLRIFSKVFSIQNLFVNVLVPQLRQVSQVLPMGQFKLGQYTFQSPPPALRSLANHMLYNTQVIVQIALMVDCEDYEDVCCLSTSVLGSLASAPADNSVYIEFPNHVNTPIGGLGSRLAGILFSSDSANEIIFGFGERLEIDTAEITTYDDYEYDFNTIPFWLAEKTMGNIYRYDLEENDYYRHTASVRIGILDILLKNMGKDVPSPTIAEFLLGYDVKDPAMKGIQQNSIITDKRARLACLLSILSMVNAGIDTDDEETQQPLIQSHPVLAEKCYQLIYKLCARESTSNGTLQYLRGSHDFMLKQFQAITCRLERCVSVSEPYFAGELITADQTRVKTDYLTLVSVLNQRAWLMKLIALDLHQIAGTSLKSESSKILNLMYGVSSNDDLPITAKFKSVRLSNESVDYQQPMWNLIEIINSLDFTWVDQLDTPQNAQKDTKFSYFKDFDAKKHMIKKMNEYEIYDIRNIYKTLRQYQLTNATVMNLSDEDRANMEFEMGSLLKQLMADNRHREISYGRLHCLRAWKQVVEITISDCFESFTFEVRERIIYDLLNVLLPKLKSDTGLHVDILKGLSEVILSLLTRLREDKSRQAILQVASPMDTANATDSKLPTDKLNTVFTMVIDCICKEKTSLEVRSTMYSALVNLLHYITPDDGVKVEATTSDTQKSLPGRFRAQITQLLEDQSKSPLFKIICSDASEGLDAYKSTAYTALEAIYVLLNEEGRSSMHRLLVRNAFLKYAIEVIESSNDALLHIIEDRDASLIPLNIHEAKISFFMQIALNKEGASLLLNNGILQSLNNCTFLKIRPEDVKYRKNPNALKRYRRLLIPILELVNVMLKDNMDNFMAYDMLKFEEWVKNQAILLHILQDENKQTTLSALYILQLTTSLLFQLSCQGDYFVGLENRGLDTIDSATMNLITKYCLSRNWASVVVPTNEQEEKWATEQVPATVNNHEMESMLVAKADKYIIDIINNLLSYAQASTFRIIKCQEGKSFKPVFANTLDSIKDRAPNSLRKASSTSPSLTTLVACISFTGKKLNTVNAEYESLCSQQDNVSSLKYEEILEIAQTAIPKRLGIQYDSLNPTQQSQILTTEIANRCELKAKELNNLWFTVENAMFILWRHLEFYMSTDSISTVPEYSPCERYKDETVVLLQQALFKTSRTVIGNLKGSCQTVLEPVLQKLEKIPSTNLKDNSLPQIYIRIRNRYN